MNGINTSNEEHEPMKLQPKGRAPQRLLVCRTLRTSVVALILTGLGAGLGVACSSPSSDAVTETGNPPLLDRRKVEVRAADGVLIVTGAPGAVPGEAEVRVTNERTGEFETTTAEPDGSFELRIAGEPGDELILQVTIDDDSQSFDLGAVIDSAAEDAGAMSPDSMERDASGMAPDESDPDDADDDTDNLGDDDTDPDDSPPDGQVCDDTLLTATERLDTAYESADNSCTDDADCVLVTGGVPCVVTCAEVPLSQSGADSVEAAREAIDEGFCPILETNACELPERSCPTIERFPNGIGCIEGQCGAKPEPSATQCETLVAQADGILDVLASASTSCTVDDDCAIADGVTSCTTHCTEVAVSREGLESVDLLKLELEGDVCPLIHEMDCTALTGGCTAEDRFPNGVACVEGQCAPKPDEEDPPPASEGEFAPIEGFPGSEVAASLDEGRLYRLLHDIATTDSFRERLSDVLASPGVDQQPLVGMLLGHIVSEAWSLVLSSDRLDPILAALRSWEIGAELDLSELGGKEPDIDGDPEVTGTAGLLERYGQLGSLYPEYAELTDRLEAAGSELTRDDFVLLGLQWQSYAFIEVALGTDDLEGFVTEVKALLDARDIQALLIYMNEQLDSL